MKLFHGSSETIAPVIKIGGYLPGVGENVFDGLFASGDYEIAESHGNAGRGGIVFAYHVADDKIADSSDLNDRIDDVIEFLRSEVINDIDAETLESLAYAIADDECDDEDAQERFGEYLTPRQNDIPGAFNWEMQRLRGRAAAHLGFDAVEMDDEHGTSYLIVNPAIVAE